MRKKIMLVVPGKHTMATGSVIELDDQILVHLDEEPKFCEDYELEGVKYGVGNTYCSEDDSNK